MGVKWGEPLVWCLSLAQCQGEGFPAIACHLQHSVGPPLGDSLL